ncbi:zinc finger MYM-type protein 1-like [Ctenocephalides felis]|uniref:zinc finger MYM-type protein 1-like n=1 Tax=Ctenocephalides felis TaxID=7515 RepID=UPI000E6E1547|nr:zinc finger MYM-type protein 1-like [Ctenocephalides felis]
MRASTRFSIIADGTTDCSGEEQFSLFIHFVHPDLLTTNKVFVGINNPEDSKGSTLAAAIKDILLQLNLTLSMLCGECFDGVRMSGKNKGIKKILHHEQPKSIHVHCSNHSLNLALQEVTKENDKICDVRCLISSNATLKSPKKRKIYESVVVHAIEDDLEKTWHNLIAMYPTTVQERVS